jgi:hypothetical protein
LVDKFESVYLAAEPELDKLPVHQQYLRPKRLRFRWGNRLNPYPDYFQVVFRGAMQRDIDGTITNYVILYMDLFQSPYDPYFNYTSTPGRIAQHHYPPFPVLHGQDGPEFMTVDACLSGDRPHDYYGTSQHHW